MASLSPSSTTENSITVSLTGLDTNHSYIRTCKWFLDGVQVGTTPLPANAGSGSYTYSKLKANTNYSCSCEIWDEKAQNYYETVSCSATTVEKTLIVLWSWSTAELEALSKGGLTTKLSYTRWNLLIEKIQEVAAAAKISVSLSGASMTATDKILTANRFNLVRQAIDKLATSDPTGITDRSPGDKVYGYYFTMLAGSLNTKINELNNS